MTKVRLLGTLCAGILVLLTSTLSYAETPAEDVVCTEAGLTGAAWGLCNAYCEAMDCDEDPNASATACDRVLAKFQQKTTPSSLPPCITVDTDGDGKFDNEDNCPAIPNADQADADGDEVGDVCDNCITVANADQADNGIADDPSDADNGIGDACDCPCWNEAELDGIGEEEITLCNTDAATETGILSGLYAGGQSSTEGALVQTNNDGDNNCIFDSKTPNILRNEAPITDGQRTACFNTIKAKCGG